MKLIKPLLILSLSLIMFLTMACEDNDTEDPAPEGGTISGTITFAGDWPTDGTVAVSLSSNWPPQNMPAASSVLTTSSDNTYTFDPMTNQHTLGAYGATAEAYFMDATSVTVSETEYELTGLDFGADLSLTQP